MQYQVAAMTFPLKSLLVAALVASAGAVYGADAVPTAPRMGRPDVPAAASSSDLQKLIERFNTSRDQILAERQALLEQLKNATAEQKRAIIERNQAEQKERIDAQRELGKQIRDEMRKLRRATPGRK